MEKKKIELGQVVDNFSEEELKAIRMSFDPDLMGADMEEGVINED